MAIASLKKRFFAKLGTNIVWVLTAFGVESIIPRALGPQAYGNFSFLSNFFTQVVSFLDMGTSICFYTKLAQRTDDAGLVSFYFRFMGVVTFLITLFCLVTIKTNLSEVLWPNQSARYIIMASFWGLLTWSVEVFIKIADAHGVTVTTEFVRIGQRLVALLLICLLFFLGYLNLFTLFVYHYVIMLGMIAAFIFVFYRKKLPVFFYVKLTRDKVKDYFDEFYRFSHPLLFFSIVALVTGILDRYLLQLFAGSVEQGFLGLSYKIGVLCSLFVSAMTPLIIRELAIAFDAKDHKRMQTLFRRQAPPLYFIGAYSGCFVCVQAAMITSVIGGQGFSEASLAVRIMAFYPINTSYAYIGSSYFFAVGQTGVYRNIGSTSLMIGLPITYFLIAPASRFGLDLGAVGVAAKMVGIQFVTINIILYVIAKQVKLSFMWFFAHQLLTLFSLIVTASVSSFLTNSILPAGSPVIVHVFTSGVLYTCLTALLVFAAPFFVGLKQKELKERISSWIAAVKARHSES